MVHYFLRHGGMHFGPGSTRQRHHDKGDPSSDTAWSREPESAGQDGGKRARRVSSTMFRVPIPRRPWRSQRL